MRITKHPSLGDPVQISFYNPLQVQAHGFLGRGSIAITALMRCSGNCHNGNRYNIAPSPSASLTVNATIVLSPQVQL